MEDLIMNITYTRAGDYYIPDLAAPETKYEIGKYGKLRLHYLKTNRKCYYSYLMTTGKLFEHLHEIDDILSRYNESELRSYRVNLKHL